MYHISTVKLQSALFLWI